MRTAGVLTLLALCLLASVTAGRLPGRKERPEKGSHPEPELIVDETPVIEAQWEGLSPSQIDQFRANGVVIEDVDGVPHRRFQHPGEPSQEIKDQFPGFGNPNPVRPQNHNLEIPRRPRPREEPGCLPMGPIGMTVEGYVFFNPYTIDQEDAIENEIMGKCNGHPSPDGAYHHHALNNCTYNGTPDQLLGVAFDGIAILSPIDTDGRVLMSRDLDQCHGKVDSDGIYRYRVTSDFPYVLGCYRGDPRNVDLDRPNCTIPQTTKRGTFIDMLVKLAVRSKSTRLNSSHITISYAVFCLKKKTTKKPTKTKTTKNNNKNTKNDT